MFRREEGQTDLAGREGDVRVGYPGCEVDCWWCEGVVWWDCDSEVPEAAWRSCYVSTDVVVNGLGGLPRRGVYLRMESRLRL